MLKKTWIICLLFNLCMQKISAQNNDFFEKADPYNAQRITSIAISGSVTYLLSMYALNKLWYKKHRKKGFHFFNDLREWRAMDKAGHAFTAYQVSLLSYSLLSWGGMDNTRAALYGAAYATLFLSSIEIMDAFSEGWGFSVYDVMANTLGASLFLGQQLTLTNQAFMLKYSYRINNHPKYREELLGKSFLQRAFKDYNGQTYWLNINPFLLGASSFPQWIDFSIGYGASGLLGGHDNSNADIQIERFSRFYFSADINQFGLPYSDSYQHALLYGFNGYKLPLPSIEWNSQNKWRFNPLLLQKNLPAIEKN
jgi:VanZ family protein